MTEPWTDALNFACSWASRQNTSSGIITGLSSGTYYSFTTYNPTITHSPSPICDLTALIQILNGTTWPNVDCRDMSAIVYIFAKALGISSVSIKKISDGAGNFNTKPISALGGSWHTYTFSFHQIVYFSNAVYDPTNRLQNPVRIPVNEDINNDYKPDFYNGGTWEPVNTYGYTIVD